MAETPRKIVSDDLVLLISASRRRKRKEEIDTRSANPHDCLLPGYHPSVHRLPLRPLSRHPLLERPRREDEEEGEADEDFRGGLFLLVDGFEAALELLDVRDRHEVAG
jgi:hypothetical protein